MKVSLIVTCKNEEKTIKQLLDSIIKQSKNPDELIIVDGGSGDRTVEIIKKYSNKYSLIKLFVSKGASVGKGRNIAITKAKNEIIAITDAGCILDKNWLKNITRPFITENVDIVIGNYKPRYTNDFEYFESIVTVPSAKKIFKKTTRWTSKSLSLKKKVWENVGGYPNLNFGEDTKFHLKLIDAKYKFASVKNAVVYWDMRKSWSAFFKQFYNYGSGTKKSGTIWRMHDQLLLIFGFWISVLVIFLSIIFKSIIAEVILLLFFLYFLLNGLKLAITSKKLKGIFYGFLLLLIKRIAFVLGATLGK